MDFSQMFSDFVEECRLHKLEIAPASSTSANQQSVVAPMTGEPIAVAA